MIARDLTPDHIGRTIAIHTGKTTHTGRIEYIGRTPLGLIQIDLDTGWHDVPGETVVTDQEVPWR